MTDTSKPVMTMPASSEPKLPENDDHQRHKSHWWVWLLIVAAAIAGIFFYRQHQSAASAKTAGTRPSVRSVPIQAAEATRGDIGEYVVALGTVTPVYTVTVTSRVLGQIMNVYYREGQTVHKGDPILDIDPRPYEAAVTQAEGQLAHDQAILNEAKIDYDRYKAALARNAIAQQQVADQEQVVQQDEGTVKNDQGTLANAKVNLAYTHITSPIDGRVGLRLVDPGNIVQANSTTPLVVITQLQPITVIFSVAEDYLSQIQEQYSKGVKMQVEALDRQQQRKLATGFLLTLDNQVDPTTGTVKLRAEFDNRDGALFPNEFVNAKLLLRTLHSVTLVPAQAVQQGSQGTFLYQINAGGTAAMQPVKVITSDGTVTAVEGVEAGATVATAGFDKLQDGAKVAIIHPGQGAAEQGANRQQNQNGGMGNPGGIGEQGQSPSGLTYPSAPHKPGQGSGQAPGAQRNPAQGQGKTAP